MNTSAEYDAYAKNWDRRQYNRTWFARVFLGLSPRMWSVLRFLERDGPSSYERLNSAFSQAITTMEALEKRGLITPVVPSSRYQRGSAWRITARGVKKLREAETAGGPGEET